MNNIFFDTLLQTYISTFNFTIFCIHNTELQ